MALWEDSEAIKEIRTDLKSLIREVSGLTGAVQNSVQNNKDWQEKRDDECNNIKTLAENTQGELTTLEKTLIRKEGILSGIKGILAIISVGVLALAGLIMQIIQSLRHH